MPYQAEISSCNIHTQFLKCKFHETVNNENIDIS